MVLTDSSNTFVIFNLKDVHFTSSSSHVSNQKINSFSQILKSCDRGEIQTRSFFSLSSVLYFPLLGKSTVNQILDECCDRRRTVKWGKSTDDNVIRIHHIWIGTPWYWSFNHCRSWTCTFYYSMPTPYVMDNGFRHLNLPNLSKALFCIFIKVWPKIFEPPPPERM